MGSPHRVFRVFTAGLLDLIFCLKIADFFDVLENIIAELCAEIY